METKQKEEVGALLTEQEHQELTTAAHWRLGNGNYTTIAQYNPTAFLLKFRRLTPYKVGEVGEGIGEYKDRSIVLSREELDSIISMYFEDYSLGKCEAVLIHKLLLKRGFTDAKTLETAKVLVPIAAPAVGH